MKITVVTQDQLPIIKDLAYAIWPDAYGEILSKEQLDYMLKLIYNVCSLQQQLEKQHIFLLVEDENQFIGFASYELNYENSNKTKIQKIYILPTIQGKGIGRKVIDYIKDTAIKNKNPMTLRAVYSSYISLIHNSIFMTFNSDFLNRKYGFFANMNMYGEKQTKHQTGIKNDNKSMDIFIKALMDKFPKNYNENYYLLNRLDIYPIIEVDSLRIHSTKPDGVSIDDWWYLYMRFFKHLDKNDLKIKSKFIKSDKRNNQTNYIDIIVNELLFEPIYKKIMDADCVREILRVISEDISIKTNNKGYMDENFNLIVKSNSEYLDSIYEAIKTIRDKII